MQGRFEYDTLGNAKRQSVGGLVWEQTFDESGNVTSAAAPNRKATKYGRDANGQLVDELLPDASKKKHKYAASGADAEYRDETEEPTITLTDLVGRPTSRTYADGTAELYTYEGPRLKSYTDRQKRATRYDYDSAGRISIVWFNNEKILRYDYDEAGRVRLLTNKDAQLEFANFDLDGNPRKTIQRRFKDGSGLGGPIPLDEFVQEHEWNVHGERTSWTMPRYSGFVPANGWTDKVIEGHDAAGNVNSIERTLFGSTTQQKLMEANFRDAGRPEYRNIYPCVTTDANCRGAISRQYGSDATDGRLNKLEVKVGDTVVAGSSIQFDGLQISDEQLLGIGGERHDRFAYDDRSRLNAAAYGVSADAEPAAAGTKGREAEKLTPADFRLAQERTSALDAPAQALLEAKKIDTSKIDPPSLQVTEAVGGGHKINTLTRGANSAAFTFNASEVSSDGTYVYEFDSLGRLVKMSEKPASLSVPLRRVVYSYSPNDRLVGERAEYAEITALGTMPPESNWKLEDRPGVIAADGMPPEITYVWDPVSDTVVAAFKAGSNNGAAGGGSIDSNGGLLRQWIHGGLGYDDPIETTVMAGTAVDRLYPIYDEAGAGNLQVLLNRNAEVVSRNVVNDPYVAQDLTVGGAAVDNIAISGKRDDKSELTSVDITLHLTEEVAPSTVVAGTRLAVLRSDGSVLRTSAVQPQVSETDSHAIRWNLTPAEWASLVAADGSTTPAILSVAVTKNLRASTWAADVPVLPAPDWATQTKPLFTSSDYPVESRESLASLSSFLAAIPAGTSKSSTIYEVETLSLLGSSDPVSEIPALLTSTFHAHPLTSRLGHLDYVRARWLHRESGAWMTADPVGYRDSSNVYAFAGGDPVDGRDPSGMASDVNFDPSISQFKERERANEKAAKAAAESALTAKEAEARLTLRLYAAHWRRMQTAAGRRFKSDDPSLILGFTGFYVDAIGNFRYDHKYNDSQGLEDESADIVATAIGLRIGGSLVAAAFKAGGWRMATITAADELVGQILGVNPSAPFSIRRNLRRFLGNEAGAVGEQVNSVILRENLKAAGVRSTVGGPNAAHHIVAYEASMAAPARAHLQRLGIGLNEAENGVFMRYTEVGIGSNHRGIHTNRYYAEVNRRVLQATTPEQLRFVLREIGDELLQGIFPY